MLIYRTLFLRAENVRQMVMDCNCVNLIGLILKQFLEMNFHFFAKYSIKLKLDIVLSSRQIFFLRLLRLRRNGKY